MILMVEWTFLSALLNMGNSSYCSLLQTDSEYLEAFIKISTHV